MQSLDQSQHPRRQLVSDSGGWLPRTSLLDQLQNAAAAAATRALVSVAIVRPLLINPLTHTVAIMGTAVKRSVPDRVKP